MIMISDYAESSLAECGIPIHTSAQISPFIPNFPVNSNIQMANGVQAFLKYCQMFRRNDLWKSGKYLLVAEQNYLGLHFKYVNFPRKVIFLHQNYK